MSLVILLTWMKYLYCFSFFFFFVVIHILRRENFYEKLIHELLATLLGAKTWLICYVSIRY